MRSLETLDGSPPLIGRDGEDVLAMRKAAARELIAALERMMDGLDDAEP